ncbi:MAG: PilN domain-containing protein [Firmicutes bacterium]|nr:PilN domain-containing protein [Bacillota bacterium]
MKINLMPVEHRPLKQSKVRWEFVVISLGLALLIAVLGFGYMQNLRLDALKQQYQNAVSYTNSLREQARAVQELEKEVVKQTDKLTYYSALAQKSNQHGLTEQVLVPIIDCVPDGLWLTEVSIDNQYTEITGYAVDFRTITEFLRNLGEQGFTAKVNSINAASSIVVDFQIDVQRR